MVSLEADPLAGVRVMVVVLGGSPTPAALITEVIWPMVTWQVFGDAQPFP